MDKRVERSLRYGGQGKRKSDGKQTREHRLCTEHLYICDTMREPVKKAGFDTTRERKAAIMLDEDFRLSASICVENEHYWRVKN